MGKSHDRISATRRVDRYFLEEAHPYSKRRPIRVKNLAWVGCALLAALLVLASVFGAHDDKKVNSAFSSPSLPSSAQVSPTNRGVATQTGGSSTPGGGGSFFGGGSGILGFSLGGSGNRASNSRTYSANQVIRRGAGGNDPEAQLPIGSAVPVRLLNAILSTDSVSPVLAEVTEDVYAHGTISIPIKTRAIGNARYDESSRRIQLQFQTLVYPEGDQHAVQAMGMMSDGSAGLSGDYHSGETKRQVGSFLGHFVSGMADGMKDRQTGGQFGMAYEPGSVKNGVLNGLTLSAEDQAKQWSSEMSGAKPFMTLPAGIAFILFLEREYVP